MHFSFKKFAIIDFFLYLCGDFQKKNKYIIDLICKGTCEDKVTEALKQGKELLDMSITDVELFKYFG